MNNYTSVSSVCHEWVGVYLNGTLINEGHQWDADTMVQISFELFNDQCIHEFVEVCDQWLDLDEGGTFPLKFEDIPEYAFV